MDPTSTELRAARATLEDGRRFARYLDQAAEGFFRLMLGRRKDEILARAFLESGHDLSHEHATFAVDGGEVVGMVSGYTAVAHRRSSERPLREAAGRWNVRLALVGFLLAPLFRVIDSIEDGDFYLQAIAVEPEQRGRGVGSLLFEHIQRKAIEAGAKRLVLDVAASNERARGVYERRGMEVVSQWPRRIKLPGLRLLRMAKPVGTGGRDRC